MRRLDRVLRRSELVCKNDDLRRERDDTILACWRNQSPSKVVLLSKLIFIRDELKSLTGASSASLYSKLAWAYQYNVDQDNSIKAMKAAIARSSDGSERASYYSSLACIYFGYNQIDLAKKEWRNVGESENWKMSRTASSSLAGLAKRFDDAGAAKTCDEILSEVFKHSNQAVIEEFDEILRQRIKKFLTLSDYANAELFIKWRLEAGSACANDRDSADWNMQLAELYLLTDRPRQSKHIYETVRRKLAQKRLKR